MNEPQTYFQKGFGIKAEIQGDLRRDYHSALVTRLKEAGRQIQAGDLTVRLAAEFGFCYGVDRAIEYAYETRRKFPDRSIFLVGEIIHNPGVNARLEAMGIRLLTDDGSATLGLSLVTADDVVLIPAFGVTTQQMEHLRAVGCVLVDTTCGSVLNVWKRVERYSKDGFTSLIHGKHHHEETRATASRALAFEGAHYLVVRDHAETDLVCDYLAGRGDRDGFLAQFAAASSPGFDPDLHLGRVGVANQTTMLSSESLAIAARVREAIVLRHGEEHAAEHFRSFDTICSATQDRQDAVLQLLAEGVDVMLVIGGYNSSNTANLAHLCAEQVRTFHVATSECVEPDGSIRHRLVGGGGTEIREASWLPGGTVTVGVTAGASTPDGEVGAVIERVFGLRGRSVPPAPAD